MTTNSEPPEEETEATEEELEAIRVAEAEEDAYLARHAAAIEEEYERQREARAFARE